MAASIQLEHVAKSFGSTVAVGPVSFEVHDGEFVSLLGPSGCGKTTTLRMIAGFEEPSSGIIRIGGRVVNDVLVERRGVGMVFQNYALFPHLSVFDNVAFGLRIRKVPAAELKERVQRSLALVGLETYGHRMPGQLSGGQQQRVALARALVVEPAVLLLDEPLSNLDLKLREQMRDEIRRLQHSLGITAVYVTHDQGEAMAVSDRIVVMNAGRIEQIGNPQEIYESPATLFVAGFIGQCNFLTGTLQGSGEAPRFITRGGSSFAVTTAQVRQGWQPGRALTLVIRPENVEIVATPADADGAVNRSAATVESLVYLGEEVRLTLRLNEAGERIMVSVRPRRGEPAPAVGDAVPIAVPPGGCIIVDREVALP